MSSIIYTGTITEERELIRTIQRISLVGVLCYSQREEIIAVYQNIKMSPE